MKIFFKLFFSSTFFFIFTKSYSCENLCSNCKGPSHLENNEVTMISLNKKVDNLNRNDYKLFNCLGFSKTNCGEFEGPDDNKTILNFLKNNENDNNLIKEGIENTNLLISQNNEKIDKNEETILKVFGDVSDEKINLMDTLNEIKTQTSETKIDKKFEGIEIKIAQTFKEIEEKIAQTFEKIETKNNQKFEETNVRMDCIEELIKSQTYNLRENNKKTSICIGMICKMSGHNTINVDDNMYKIFEEIELATTKITLKENTIKMYEIINIIESTKKGINDNTYKSKEDLLPILDLIKNNCENIEYN